MAATFVIGWFGWKLAGVAEELAGRTGMGQAITGGLFLGAVTSMPGLIASVTAALDGFPRMAASNAIGGIAAQTAFLGIADICYRKVNLEHAAASLANLMQAGLLVGLLSLALVAAHLPASTWWGIHPVSGALMVGYLYGLRLAERSRDEPMWRPTRTPQTQKESDAEPANAKPHRSLPLVWLNFAVIGIIVGGAGWFLARIGIAAIQRANWSESVTGGLLTAVSSSLPELVTAIAAVRHGAFALAVGGIIGGNAFDTLFLAASDVAYRPGSIYHAFGDQQHFLIALSILMTAILLMGLVSREKRGIGNIGFESFGILTLYAFAVAMMFRS